MCGEAPMTSGPAAPGGDGKRAVRCACGLAFACPWELIGHFLAVWPPDADEPLDHTRHADVTLLAVKLAEGPTEAWDFIALSLDPRRYLRVAASIAMRAATGELAEWEELRYQAVREAYQASTYVTKNALGELQDRGIADNLGGRVTIAPRDWVQARDARHRRARIFALITAHVMSLEAEVSALKASAGRAGPAGEEPASE
jgi:hypothetical protein